MLVTLEVSAKLTELPEQIVLELAFVIVTAGITVTVIVWFVPTQEPVVEVGVTT